MIFGPASRLATLLALFNVHGGQPVPKISDFDAGAPNGWTRISSNQVIEAPESKQKKLGEWQVLEFFSLKHLKSVGYYRNAKTKEEFKQISFGQRMYFVHFDKLTGKDVCNVEHRHDIMRIYPLVYKRLLEDSQLYGQIHGLGAVWMNLQDLNIDCQLADNLELICKSTQGLISYQIKFDLSDNKRPKEAQIIHGHSIHEKQDDLIHKRLILRAHISSIQVGLQDKELQQVDSLIELCQQTAYKNEPEFPNLMHAISSSPSRKYIIKYEAEFYKFDKSLEASLNNHLHVTETFSIEHEKQSIRNLDLVTGESRKFVRIFNIIKGVPVSYLIETRGDTVSCSFGHYEFPITDLADLARSRVPLKPLVRYQSGGRNIKRIPQGAELIGIGAILMNVHHFYKSKEANQPSVYQFDLDATRRDYCSWIVEGFDGEPDLRLIIRFRRKPQLIDCDIHDFDSILVQRYQKFSAFGEEYGFVTIVRVSDASCETNSVENVKYEFILPSKCPQAVDSQADREDDQQLDDGFSVSTEKPDETNEQIDFNEYEFPALELLIGPTVNYKITSMWKFSDESQARVCEYLYYDTQLDTNNLFARFDIVITSKSKPEERIRYYLRYLHNSFVRFDELDDGSCRQVFRLEPWLDDLSSKLTYGPASGYSLDQNTDRAYRHYGVGGLWQEASVAVDTFFVTKLAKLEKPLEYYALWMLKSDNSERKYSLMYNFTMLTSKTNDQQSFRLDSIIVNTKDMNTFDGSMVLIEDILIEPQEPKANDFILPTSCHFDNSGGHNYVEPRLDFPTFEATFDGQAASEPSKIDYELAYDLLLTSATGQRFVFKVKETNQKDTHQMVTISFGDPEKVIQLIRFHKMHEQKKNLIFLYDKAGSNCKTITRLNELFLIDYYVDMIETSFELDSSKQSSPKLMMVANLWNLFGKRAPEAGITMSSKSQHRNGEHLRLIDWTLSNEKGVVKFEFRKSETKRDLCLYAIVLEPYEGMNSGTVFDVRMIFNYVGEIRELDTIVAFPVDCLSEQSDDSRIFPKLTNLMGEHDLAYMRSEIIVRGRHNLLQTHHLLLEEWLFSHKQYRVIVTDNSDSKIADHLMYLETEESFDLTPQLNDCKQVTGSKLSNPKELEWFRIDLHTTTNPVPDLYGPLAFWALVGQSMDTLSLNEMDIKLTLIDLLDEEKLAQWFTETVWQFKKSKTTQDNGHIDYELRFGHRFDEFSHEYFAKIYFLNSIQSYHVSGANYAIDELSQSIATSVVDYRFISDRKQCEKNHHKFLIPLGRGCRRNSRAIAEFKKDSIDMIAFYSSSPVYFNYEANLEIKKQPNGPLEPSQVLLSGLHGSCGQSWALMNVGDLIVDYQRFHYRDGHVESKKSVSYNDLAGIRMVRLIDELTGTCSIEKSQDGLEKSQRFLALHFKDLEEPIKVTYDFLKAFEIGMTNFERLQTIEGTKFSDELSEGERRVIYESPRQTISLNKQLSGEGYIIRTFTRTGRTKSLSEYNYHNDIKIEMILPEVAHLSLQIHDITPMECLDIILEAGASDCFRETGTNFELETSPNIDQPKLLNKNRIQKFELKFEKKSVSYDKDNQFKAINLSLERFEEERIKIETRLYQILLSKPDEFPVMQVGQIGIRFEAFSGSIVASFSLIEPTAAFHQFNELPKYSLKRSVGDIRLVKSQYSCSDLCENNHNICYAFAYCQDHTCKTVGADEYLESETIEDDQVFESLKSSILEDATCNLYYAPSLKPRMYIRNMVELIEGQLRLSGVSNKFRLDVKINEKLRLYYVATELRQVASNGAESHLEPSVDSTNDDHLGASYANEPDYAIIKSQMDLDVQSIIKADPNLKLKVLEVEDLATCLASCTTKSCQLVTFCSRANLCKILANVNDWLAYKLALKSMQLQPECSVFGLDLRSTYSEFSPSVEPHNYLMKEDQLSAVECAAMCEFHHDQHKAAQATDCLSFDYCVSTDEYKEVCYLQNLHLIMDTFDQSILLGNQHKLEPTLDQKTSSSNYKCRHYSKTLIADFKLTPNKRYQSGASMKRTGTSLENCALICRRSPGCFSFEYCRQDAKVSSSCLLQNLNQSEDGSSYSKPNWLKLKDASNCDVYEWNKVIHLIDVDHDKSKQSVQLQLVDVNLETFQQGLDVNLPSISTLLLILGAFLIGLIIQLAIRA